MHLSDEKVLLESFCLLSQTIIRIKKKNGKRRGCGKYFKKEQNKEFTIIYWRRCVSMIENRVPGYLYNELFIKSNEEKCTALQRIVWSFIVHKNTIKAAQLLCKYFLPGLSLYTLYFFFHKCKDSSVVPQPSVCFFIVLPPWHKGVVGFSLK